MELALLSDKIDITEEIVRLQSHLKLFVETLNDENTEVGKRLTFILQEMNREINTVGSKTNQVPVSHLAVEIKEELEKMREQAQNIE